MSISITCPKCDRTQKVADDVAGKKVRCPGCKAVFRAEDSDVEVAQDDEPGPRRAKPVKRAARDDEGEKRPRKPTGKKKKRKGKPKSQLPLILGLVGGFVVLIGLGLGVAYLAGAFGSGTKGPNGPAGATGGTGGSDVDDADTVTAPGNRGQIGSPAPMSRQLIRLSNPRQNDPNSVTLDYEILPGRSVPKAVILVFIYTDGFNDHNELDVQGLAPGTKRTITVSLNRPREVLITYGRTDFWAGLKSDSEFAVVRTKDRVSNVVGLDVK